MKKKIPIFEPFLNKKKTNYNLTNCIKTNWISSQGVYIKDFEKKLAAFNNVRYCLTTSSCTSALHLSILSLGLKKGDEILCPSLTFIAPANMIILSQFNLKIIDIDEDSLTIDPKLILRNLSNKTKAILVVHQFGHAAKMDEIMKIAKKNNLKVIEDNAESIGGYFKNKKLGSIGDVATLSFYANKIITTAEGGAILTNSKKIFQNCLVMRDHGMSRKRRYDFITLGFNYRMTNLQAAIGLSQVMDIKKILSLRRKQQKLYEEKLANNKNYKIRSFANWVKPAHWLTTITLQKQKDRNLLIKFLKNKGIEARPMVFPINESEHIKKIEKKTFPIAKKISYRSLHLPSSTSLTKSQIERVCNGVNSFFK